MYTVLQPLIDACDAVLKFWHGLLGDFPGSWASIILLTFTVRLVILPLTFKGVKGMQRMQQLQPEIKEIQARYKDDKQRMNQEVMAFYQREKVNPLGSCLPLALQIPFFISLFQLLRSDVQGGHRPTTGFLAIPDLSVKVTGDPVLLVILIVLYVGTQLAASLVTAISADPTQRRIMLALPFVFTIFIVNFPAGLIVYWITTNVWTIGQQLLVKKLYPKPEPMAAGEDAGEGGKPARGKPPSPEPASNRPGRIGRPLRPRTRKATTGGTASAAPRQPAKHRRPHPARRRSAPGGGDERGSASRGPVGRRRGRQPGRGQVGRDEGAGAPLPGHHRRVRALRYGGGTRSDGTAVRAEVDEDAWREAAEQIPEEPGERVRAVVARVPSTPWGSARRSTSTRATRRSGRR